MGSIVRLIAVVTSPKMLAAVVLCSSLVVITSSAPQGLLPPGVDPVSCPNFPFCGPSPVASAQSINSAHDQALLVHRQQEEAVRAAAAANPAVVGHSGNIGASGIVGA